MNMRNFWIMLLIGLSGLPGTAAAQTVNKCELPGGRVVYQDMPCTQGKSVQQMDATREAPATAVPSAGARGSRAMRGSTQSSVPAAVPAPAASASRQRCPYTSIAGDDMELDSQKNSLFLELFYVDPWKDSLAAMSAPGPGEDRRKEEERRERCDALIDEYHEIGEELIRVTPKSLLSVQSCFQKEARRLDAQGRKLGCHIERVIKIKR